MNKIRTEVLDPFYIEYIVTITTNLNTEHMTSHRPIR